MLRDFDPATLSKIFEKYLDPAPRFEAFNSLTTEAGERYILIVLGPEQPRPVVVVTEATSDGRTYLRAGDIWVKKDTGLRMATRADLEAMYEKRIDREAETLKWTPLSRPFFARNKLIPTGSGF